jgi:hypothetical protein
MTTFVHYARRRYFCKSHGWGRTWVRWLWLDALLFAAARWSTLHSPWFRAWCRAVDRVFSSQYEWEPSYTRDTGLDSWIDSYWEGLSPEDAAYSEVQHWDG